MSPDGYYFCSYDHRTPNIECSDGAIGEFGERICHGAGDFIEGNHLSVAYTHSSKAVIEARIREGATSAYLHTQLVEVLRCLETLNNAGPVHGTPASERQSVNTIIYHARATEKALKVYLKFQYKILLKSEAA